MSRETVVAKRYAKALYEAATSQGATQAVEDELNAVAGTLQSNDDIRRFIDAPSISKSEKLAILRTALNGKVSSVVLNTVELLVDRGRTDILGDLVDTYVKIKGDALGIGDARVYSAYPLSESEQAAVAAEFGALVGRTIRVTNTVDESLIGGLKVVIGDTLYDGSVAGKLERLEKSFNEKHRR